MKSQTSFDNGLDYLLSLDGEIQVQNEQGYWVKIEARRVSATADRPHGIKYSLTLHAPDGSRLVGFDNAHAVSPSSAHMKRVGKHFPHDHRHRSNNDAGVLYEFDTAWQLMKDFYAQVDFVMKKVIDE